MCHVCTSVTPTRTQKGPLSSLTSLLYSSAPDTPFHSRSFTPPPFHRHLPTPTNHNYLPLSLPVTRSHLSPSPT